MKGKRWVLTAAMMVAGLRLWTQVRGKAKTPFQEWAIGWGVAFFFLALVSETYPQFAGALAGTVVVGDFLQNGAALFEDLSGVATGATKSGLADHPFGGTDSSSTSTSGSSSTTHHNVAGNRTSTQHPANIGGSTGAAAGSNLGTGT